MTEQIITYGEHDKLLFRYAPGGTVEIVDIAVDNLHRRKGLGRQMIRDLVKTCRDHGDIKLIYAITRQSNRIAQEFYSVLGFELIGCLAGFYRIANEAALVYGLKL